MIKMISIFPKKFGFFPYIFLIYLLFPIYFLTKETGIKQLAGYGMVVLFLVAYRQLFHLMERKSFSFWLVIQLAIVFILSIFYDLNYLFLGFFPANFVGWYSSKKMFKFGFIGLVIVEIVPFIYQLMTNPRLSAVDIIYVIPFIIIMLISPFGIRSMNRRMELEQELERANETIAELVKREERVRIARDLHDTLGHTLSLLTLKSQLVQKLVKVDIERAKLEAKEMEDTSRAALKQVRELVTDMRTITIAEELLHAQRILRAAGITYHYEGESIFSNISPFIQNIMGMCIREAVTNIIKHSDASHCKVKIVQMADMIKITMKDDGIGIDEKKLYGNGLKGIEERLTLIDGILVLSNSNGAAVQITVPIIKKADREEGAIG
ncbi:sensor histidine kinase [Metabacillus fastidiosus]|uniref:sensor histidine kinase n=1 Tax=Metabacillus fastidiosus TaxID=1458 RepID=UPI002DBDC18C|nr:sensor histidine kinase [Metabacillus fastidiosus]MEC2077400.1 sensor histidine kinase [Metabacillus fastidiosus]